MRLFLLLWYQDTRITKGEKKVASAVNYNWRKPRDI